MYLIIVALFGLGHCSWLSPMFHDNVVLQKAPQSPLIWGTGSPGESIRIEIYDPDEVLVIEFGGYVEEDGTWKVLNIYNILEYNLKLSLICLSFYAPINL